MNKWKALSHATCENIYKYLSVAPGQKTYTYTHTNEAIKIKVIDTFWPNF